ncbi:MAG: hypothetical protein OK439_04300, partial [Thaumarchaeota archaeon]|nr:hypothetical protein [Nitrososphaerota archaeon]
TFISRDELRSVKSNELDIATALKSFSSGSKMMLFIRSKKVAVASEIVSISVFISARANPTKVSRRITIYENVLDQEQKDAVENSASLAKSLGVELEIRDVAKLRILSRIINSIFRDKLVARTPSVSFTGGAITSLVSASYAKELQKITGRKIEENSRNSENDMRLQVA